MPTEVYRSMHNAIPPFSSLHKGSEHFSQYLSYRDLQLKENKTIRYKYPILKIKRDPFILLWWKRSKVLLSSSFKKK